MKALCLSRATFCIPYTRKLFSDLFLKLDLVTLNVTAEVDTFRVG